MAKQRAKRTIESDIFGYPVRPDGINSKKKGDNNERTVAKWLQEWTGVAFTRVPRSGGLRWSNTANVCGDVVCEDADFNFPFSVETKHLKRVTFEAVLRSNSRILSIYHQCKEDAVRANKTPMLILRKDGMPSGEFVVYFERETAYLFDGLEEISAGAFEEVTLVGFRSKDILTIKFADVVKNF